MIIHSQEVMSEGDGYRILWEMQGDSLASNKAQAKFDNRVQYHIDDDGKLITDAIVTILHIEEVEEKCAHGM